MATSPLRVKYDGVKDLHAAMKALTTTEVLVGFPEETTDRRDGAIKEPTNAELGYIHNTGMPEQNIPAREFMVSGIMSVVDRLVRQLEVGARAGLGKNSAAVVDQNMHRVGSIAELGIKKMINSGIPPPLADATLRAREAKVSRKGNKLELERRAAGLPPSTAFAKPLIDTAQMRNAVKYVIRDRKKRKS